MHLQYLANNQSRQRCQLLITQGSDHPPVLEPHIVLTLVCNGCNWRHYTYISIRYMCMGIHKYDGPISDKDSEIKRLLIALCIDLACDLGHGLPNYLSWMWEINNVLFYLDISAACSQGNASLVSWSLPWCTQVIHISFNQVPTLHILMNCTFILISSHFLLLDCIKII
jgi:hypothetical protein